MSEDTTVLTETTTPPAENKTVETKEAAKVAAPVVEETKKVEQVAQVAKPEDGKANAEKPAGAPEQYDLKLSEEFQVDDGLMGEFTTLAKGKNFDQETAQALVDMQTKFMKQQQEASVTLWSNTLNEWRDAATNDKEIGGAKFDENLAAAKKTLDTFGSAELKEALDYTGMGNHPELIRLLVKVGKQLNEDTIRAGSAVNSQPKTLAEVLYPSMNK